MGQQPRFCTPFDPRGSVAYGTRSASFHRDAIALAAFFIEVFASRGSLRDPEAQKVR